MKTIPLISTKLNSVAYITLAIVMGLLSAWSQANASPRRLVVGQKVPEFSGTDVAGQPFDYKHGSKKAVIVAFLSATQKRSADAATDINRIIEKLGSKAPDVNVIIVLYDPNDQSSFQPIQGQLQIDYRIVPDVSNRLWGKFGIIAFPTVIVSDTQDTVLCVEAGYAYDFSPVIAAQLNRALGIAQSISPEDAEEVKTAVLGTVAARAMRHLQMARILKKKGRLKSAIRQTQQAWQIDPNCVGAGLELAELYCQSHQAQTALEVTGRLKAENLREQATISFLSGWAMRQMGRLDDAEKLLLEATAMNVGSSRAFFELGKIYEARGQTEKAMASYRKALTQIFGETRNAQTSAQQKGREPRIAKTDTP